MIKKKTNYKSVNQCLHSNLTSTQKTRNFKVNECIYFYVYLFYICVYVHTHTYIYTDLNTSKRQEKGYSYLIKKEGKGMDCSKYSLASIE